MTEQDDITSLRQQVETLKQDVSIWKASAERWAHRHAEVHAQVETLTQERDAAERQCADAERFANTLSLQLASLAAAQERMTAQLRTMAMVAGQASVESLDSTHAAADARFAGYCTRWADQLESAALPSLAASSREK